MKKTVAAENPDAYVEGLAGWQHERVTQLRAAVRSAGELDEVVKWGHLVYLSNGPVLLIRAEEHRVLLGFWRGKRLREDEPRLKAGGKFELATLVLDQAASISAAHVRRLAKKAIALNAELGDPTRVANTHQRRAATAKQRPAKKRAKA